MFEKIRSKELSLKEIFFYSTKLVKGILPRLITLAIAIEIISLPFLSVIDEQGAIEFAEKPFMGTIYATILVLAVALGLVMLFKMEEAFVNNKTLSFKQAFDVSKKVFIPFVITAIICDVIIMLGFSFFVIPGIILFALFIFTYHAAALRNKYYIDAFKYSLNLVKGKFWDFLAAVIILLAASVIITVIVIVFDIILGYILSIFGSVGYFISAMISFVLFFVPGAYIFVAYTLFFLNRDYLAHKK